MGSELAANNHRRLLRLRCSVQHYDWGRVGPESLVGRLSAFNSRSEIQPDKPYAELWMGVHDSGPSFVVSGDDNGESSLKDWIAQNPAALGHKILSVAEALSIQAHPDKELAKQLHKSHPIAYKDDNHKPEMALALSEFHALCGFISLQVLLSSMSCFYNKRSFLHTH
ncbi:unnamed protein product [Linum tenue]|uniref:Phosphomannose isomerase type I catalytic domain-containing protein n=1 Tax=Linum tenue TaxID=586396 RepID=A0AAV0PMR0_9ROSI|nr:unnamed protein product [Linum tenue]